MNIKYKIHNNNAKLNVYMYIYITIFFLFYKN